MNENSHEFTIIYYEKIEKILNKLAHSQSDKTSDPNKKLTELNLYIKCFINELQIPLSTLNTGLELLLHNQNLEKNKNIIINLEKTIEYIKNSFTKFNIIHDGNITLNKFEPFNIEFIIIKIKNNFSIELEEKNIKFKYHIDKNIDSWFIGDIHNITYVISNLVKNAIKYYNPKQKNNIFINITQTEIKSRNYLSNNDFIKSLNKKNIIISIHDTNKHILSHKFVKCNETNENKLPPIKKHIFNLLEFKEDKISENIPTENSGLGLYICKTIIELHNGYIIHDIVNGFFGNKFIIHLELEKYIN